MHYTTITAGELRKMNGVKVKAETNRWNIIEGEITVEDKVVIILHNNPEANGVNAKDKKGYKYSWILLYGRLEDNEPTIAINRLETIEEFTEGELVYVSDNSVQSALSCKYENVYIYTNSKGIHITQDKDDYYDGATYGINGVKYIAKIPKEEIVEMTMEEVCKALKKKIKIIE